MREKLEPNLAFGSELNFFCFCCSYIESQILSPSLYNTKDSEGCNQLGSNSAGSFLPNSGSGGHLEFWSQAKF